MKKLFLEPEIEVLEFAMSENIANSDLDAEAIPSTPGFGYEEDDGEEWS